MRTSILQQFHTRQDRTEQAARIRQQRAQRLPRGGNAGGGRGGSPPAAPPLPPPPGGSGNYWNGDWFIDAVRSQLSANLLQAGNDLTDELREVVSIPGPPRSRPGQPPHIDTDVFHPSIRAEYNPEDPEGLTVVVGSDEEYSLYLELGTGRMAARPWLRNTFAARQDAIKQTAIAGLGTPV